MSIILKNIKLFILFFICLNQSKEKKLIFLPFSLKRININSNYNTINFLNDNFQKEIILQFNIGTPLQKVNGILDQASDCFKFKQIKLDNYYNKDRYRPYLSTSVNKRNGRNIIDIMTFQNISNNYSIEFSIDNYKTATNNSYTPSIGLNTPLLLSSTDCPNLFLNLKKKGIINKLIWTIEYKNNYSGNFVIGEDLTEYDEIKYPKSIYYTLYLNLRYFITFDSVYVENKYENNNYLDNNIKFNLNSTKIFIQINYGFIIAPNEYKNIIDQIYFNNLFNKNICICETINYKFNNNSQSNMEYYVYSCYEKLFINQKNNYYNNFPNLIFSSKSIEKNLKFTNNDLFVHINNKYYFLIIFQKFTKKNDIIWYFGEPFYKKYTFSMNFDAKTIGFYIQKDKNYIESKDSNNNDRINKKNKEKKINDIYRIIKFVFEILVLIILILIAYYIAISIKERRKKRTNELNDNYEYLCKKDINNNKNPNNNKKQQFIELNSKIGI